MLTVPPSLVAPRAVTVRVSPGTTWSGSLSLASTSMGLSLLSSATPATSFTAMGSSGRLLMVMVTVAVSLPPLPSLMV